jgi:hypothetical protein
VRGWGSGWNVDNREVRKLTDSVLVLTLLAIGDGELAYLEAKRIKNNLYVAKALALKGDTSSAIMSLSDGDCKQKRYKLVLMLSRFMRESSINLVQDTSCFSDRDRALVRAHFFDFDSSPLSDSLISRLPKLINPSTCIILNFIPGLGLACAGKPIQALKTFLANLLGIGGMVYSIRRGYYVDAFVWYYFWEGRFFWGSFQNVLESTLDENQRRLRPYFEYIREQIGGER